MITIADLYKMFKAYGELDVEFIEDMEMLCPINKKPLYVAKHMRAVLIRMEIDQESETPENTTFEIEVFFYPHESYNESIPLRVANIDKINLDSSAMNFTYGKSSYIQPITVPSLFKEYLEYCENHKEIPYVKYLESIKG